MRRILPLLLLLFGCPTVQLEGDGNLQCEYKGFQVAECRVYMECAGLEVAELSDYFNGQWGLCSGRGAKCTIDLNSFSSTVTGLESSQSVENVFPEGS